MGAILTKRNLSFVVVLAAVVALVVLLSYGLTDRGGGVPRRPAPEFSLNLFDVSGGGTFSKADLAGRPAVVNFWASWCDPCEDEAPHLERVWQEYKDRGVVFLGIAVDDTDTDAQAFIRTHGLTYPNGPDETDIGLDFGRLGVPETFFIDREGQIVRQSKGVINSERLRSPLEELLDATR